VDGGLSVEGDGVGEGVPAESLATTGGFWLAWVENMRGRTHAMAISAASAMTAPSPIQSPRRGPAVPVEDGAGIDTGVNGGGCGAAYCGGEE
jgi:hypothetical protein